MLRLLIRRFIATIPVLFFVSLITFTFMHMTPGGPWDKGEGRREMRPEVKANLDRIYNLDKSLPEQYLLWLADLARGDLGPSYQFRDRTVNQLIFEPSPGRPWWESRFGRSALLGVICFILSTAIAIPLGVLAAVYQNTWIDYLSLFLATIGTAVPSFVRAILLIVLFAVWLRIAPVGNSNWNQLSWENARTWTPWLLPILALTLGTIAGVARYTRAQMLEVIRQDYMRTARSKGLSEVKILARHALRNAMIPVATILGPELAGLLTGSFFIEQIFQFPGMGTALVGAISARDYSMIMGLTMFLTFLLVCGNLMVDLMYGWLDPRIKVAG